MGAVDVLEDNQNCVYCRTLGYVMNNKALKSQVTFNINICSIRKQMLSSYFCCGRQGEIGRTCQLTKVVRIVFKGR